MAQFVAHIRARVDADDVALAHRVLPRAAWDAFDGMPAADRRHGIDVVTRLVDRGVDDADVLVAALLHDVGKGHRLRLWHRVAVVVLEAVAPALLRRLASPDVRSWRHPFWIHLHHDALSSDVALRAGASARAARLIRGRPDGAREARLLAALKAADDAS